MDVFMKKLPRFCKSPSSLVLTSYRSNKTFAQCEQSVTSLLFYLQKGLSEYITHFMLSTLLTYREHITHFLVSTLLTYREHIACKDHIKSELRLRNNNDQQGD
jgi:hypothetical protein